jgi:hypothetical protein
MQSSLQLFMVEKDPAKVVYCVKNAAWKRMETLKIFQEQRILATGMQNSHWVVLHQ